MVPENDLIGAIQALSCTNLPDDDGWIDSVLDQRQPRKRAKPGDGELRKQLEKDFLTPSQVFSSEWLNKLQQ